jgi:catechol 2,3-dioxygenase-like lactoylglutathione lyase family enzyme
MLGRFLEVSVYTPAILESIAFYAALGFQQASTNETWTYPYAVMTDGRLFIGLHQQVIKSPALCFVQSDVAKHASELRKLGIVFDDEHLSSDSFNELSFHDPDGQQVRLLEARTYSPPDIDAAFSSSCGYFVEYGMPVREFTATKLFWEQLGFVGMEEETQPFNRLALTSDHLNLGLHRSRALRQPVLVFEDENMCERLTYLKERGIDLSDEMPDSLDEHSNALLIAPEGTRLLLIQIGE